jgi:AraC-like DNA-binding protein
LSTAVAESINNAVQFFAASSFKEWRQKMSSRFVRLNVTTDHPDNFRASVRSREYDGISLSQVFAGSHQVDRPLNFIHSGERQFFKLSLQLSGTGLIVQDGREAALLPGDMAIYDTSRPYSMAFDNEVESLVLIFPHDLLKVPADAISQLTAVRMPGDSGMGQMVGPFLRQLGQNLNQFSGHSGSRIAHNVLDLVSTLVYTELDLDNTVRPHSNLSLMMEIQDFIEKHLGDPELNPTRIADAHYISTRRLHYLFQAEGTTVTAWIKGRRLEHCRRDLRDPSLAHETVMAVGQRWGFVDSAHFSRTFKSAIGVSPSGYRHAVIS